MKIGFFLVAALSLFATGCSVRSMAVNALADTFEESTAVYLRDDDPELVGDAFPFLLKTVEGLLEEKPDNKVLLVVAAQGFTSYAQAYVAVPADMLEEHDLKAARKQRARASRLFVRAREYGLRALELDYPDIRRGLSEDPESTLAETESEDIPALFWTGAAWALAINNAKGDMDLVADFNIAGALLRRTNELDPVWQKGAAHEVLIVLEAATSGGQGGSLEKAREHFRIAMELSEGQRIGALVSLAEAVCIKEQNLEEFEHRLEEALAFDVDSAPDYRLANILSQERAGWLLDHRADLFIDYDEEAEEDL